MKILVVDDNEDITSLLSKYLKLSGFECNFSNDGRTALSMIENQKFDVVLLDLAMPEYSGVDVIDALIKNGKIKDQKILVFTASSVSKTETQELLKKGVHSCLKKPIDPDELVSYLKTISVQKNEN